MDDLAVHVAPVVVAHPENLADGDLGYLDASGAVHCKIGGANQFLFGVTLVISSFVSSVHARIGGLSGALAAAVCRAVV